MRRFLVKFMLPICAAAVGASDAAAAAITVDSKFDNYGGTSYWTRSTQFVLPGDFTSAALHITKFAVDDRGAVKLNGNLVDWTGIFAPGPGFFHFTADDANTQFYFGRAMGTRDIWVTSGFLAGVNTLEFIVNDTGYGIYFDFTGGSAKGVAGQTSYVFAGEVSYEAGGGGTVPEPASWALALAAALMAGGTGSLSRKRSNGGNGVRSQI
jgi:hypothetical protein